jgi:hypothetical protein
MLTVMSLADELDRLLGHVRELNLPVTRFLLPGTQRGNIIAALGVVPPVSVVEWFGWCNGVRGEQGQIQDDVNLIPGYNPVSVEEAVRLKRYYADEPALGANWIPLLENPGGDIYAAVWDGSEDAMVAAVLEDTPTDIEFKSILEMVKYFNECYTRKAFYVEDDGWPTRNPQVSSIIYKEMFGGQPDEKSLRVMPHAASAWDDGPGAQTVAFGRDTPPESSATGFPLLPDPAASRFHAS